MRPGSSNRKSILYGGTSGTAQRDNSRLVDEKSHKSGRTIPPWIRKRIQIETDEIAKAELLGVKNLPRPGTLKHRQIIESLMNRVKTRLAKESEDSESIPF